MNRDYIPEFKESALADLLLGGGTGFLSKTVYYALAPDVEGRQLLTQFFDDIFTTKDRRTHMKQPAHHHRRDDDMLTPRTLKLAMTEGERWIMGLTSVKEVK
jgi:CRISPR-associated protein Csm5